METLECIAKRVSIRLYKDKPVPKELIEKVVDAGRRAPSARGIEPWDFIVITDKDLLRRLGDIATSGSFIRNAPACIAVFCEDTKYYLEDGCAATENILLAVCDLGLGACWVAGDKKPYAQNIAEILGVPKDKRLICLISLGWPAEKIEQRKHKPLKDVIHWNMYKRS